MTALQHLHRLPYPSNELAVEEYTKRPLVGYEADDLIGAVCSFHWHDSEMGANFWMGVYNELKQEVVLRQAMIECKERNINFAEHFKIVRR